MTRRVGGTLRASGVLMILGSVLVLCSGGALAAARASDFLGSALGSPTAGRLEVRSLPDPPEWQDLWAGGTAHWLISAGLAGASSSSLALELRSGGGLVLDGGMTAEVVSCSSQFVPAALPGDAPECGGQAATVLPRQALAQISTDISGPRVTLARLHAGSPRYLLVTLGIPAGTPHIRLEQRTARVGVGLFAAGRSEPDGPGDPRDPGGDDPDLAHTGADLGAVALVALGALGLLAGSALLRQGARARRTGPRSGRAEADEAGGS